MAARTQQLDRTRTAIADAALRLFAEQGFGATTVEQIAAVAGVSRRTFFRYFHTKESVVFHDTDAYERATIEDLQRRLASEPPFVALVNALRAAAESVDSDQVALYGRIAVENDHLLEHHRAVVMRDFEREVAALICAATGGAPGSIAIAAGVGAILAAFGAAVQAWIISAGASDFARCLDEALAGVLDAVGSVARPAFSSR